jgi:hypothetical protein
MGWLKRKIIENMEPTEYELARRWIPVEERLPEDRQHVIACFPSPFEFMTHAVYEKDPGWFSIPNYGAAQASHWMPFPKPPTASK